MTDDDNRDQGGSVVKSRTFTLQTTSSDLVRRAIQDIGQLLEKQVKRIKPDKSHLNFFMMSSDDYKDVVPHFEDGCNYFYLGMYKEAIEAYIQAIEALYPLIEANKKARGYKTHNALAHYSLGASYYESGIYKEAIKAFKRADKANLLFGLFISRKFLF
jgi:tetratricopeptide (TPR) repeat protein